MPGEHTLERILEGLPTETLNNELARVQERIGELTVKEASLSQVLYERKMYAIIQNIGSGISAAEL